MAKKKVAAYIKLQVPAGQATPAPPVGPALGQHGLNIAQFVKEFNEQTAKDVGLVIRCDHGLCRSHVLFITKTPPVPVLLKKAANIESGSGEPHMKKVATIPWSECLRIAEIKMVDTNASSLEACARMVAGTARSMGITVDKSK